MYISFFSSDLTRYDYGVITRACERMLKHTFWHDLTVFEHIFAISGYFEKKIIFLLNRSWFQQVGRRTELVSKSWKKNRVGLKKLEEEQSWFQTYFQQMKNFLSYFLRALNYHWFNQYLQSHCSHVDQTSSFFLLFSIKKVFGVDRVVERWNEPDSYEHFLSVREIYRCSQSNIPKNHWTNKTIS